MSQTDGKTEPAKDVVDYMDHVVDDIDAQVNIDDELNVNRCLGCGVDLGACNPRQYCCKTHCPYEVYQQKL